LLRIIIYMVQTYNLLWGWIRCSDLEPLHWTLHLTNLLWYIWGRYLILCVFNLCDVWIYFMIEVYEHCFVVGKWSDCLEFNFLKKCFSLMKKVLKWFTTNLLGFYCIIELVCFHQGNYHDFAESFVHGGALLTPTL